MELYKRTKFNMLDEDKSSRYAFWQAIQAIRKERWLSTEAFALKLGIDTAYLPRIERGQKSISLSTAAKLAEALSLEIKFREWKLTR